MKDRQVSAEASTVETDLREIGPGLRADVLMETQVVQLEYETEIKFLGFRVKTRSNAPAHSAAGIACGLFLLAGGGALGSTAFAVLGLITKAPWWLTMTLASVAFFGLVTAGLVSMSRAPRSKRREDASS